MNWNPNPAGAGLRPFADVSVLGQTQKRLRSASRSGRFPDAVTYLSAYLVVLLAIPSNRTIADLGSAGSVSVLAGVGAALLWALYQVQRTQSTLVEHRPVRLALLFFLAAALVSYVAAMTRALPSGEVSVADTGLIRLAAWAGILLIANDGITSLERLLVLLRRIVVAGGLIGALGIVQFATKEAFIDLLPIPWLQSEVDYAAVESRGGLVRAAGTSNHPLEFAMVLAMILPIALALALREQNRSALARWTPVATILLGLTLSGSRSAVVGVLAGVLVLIPTWSRAVRWRLALAGVALAGVVYAMSPLVLTNMRYMFLAIFEDPSATSRSDSLGLFGHVFLLNPVVGRGLGTFLPHYRILDNQYFLFVLEIGLLGVILFAVLGLTATMCAIQAARRSPDPVTRDLGFALTGSVLAGMTLLYLFDALSFPQSAGMLFLAFGLCGAYWRLTRAPDPASVRVVPERGGRP